MTERMKLPVLPLRETVVFPGVAVPISAGRVGTVEAIQQALDGERRMFAVCQRENVDDVTPEVLYRIGVIVRVVQAQRGRGGIQLLIQGEARGEALEYTTVGETALEATLSVVEEEPSSDPLPAAYEALDRELRERAAELGRERGIPAEALSQLVEGVQEPGAFADLVAFYLELPAAEKQALLETLAVEPRMRRVLVAVERDLLRVEAQQEIQQKVQEELGEKQREMVLREQLRAIQKELGEDEEGEVDALRERIAGLDLSPEARQEVERELGRLSRTHPQSAEYQVIRTYLDTVVELPWNERSEDHIELDQASAVLDEDHFGLDDVKDRVLEFLAVRKLQMERAAAEAVAGAEAEAAPSSPGAGAAGGGVLGADPGAGAGEGASESTVEGDELLEAAPESPEERAARAKAKAVGHGPILLFVGPPGVGKTSIARSIATALGRQYVRIALGGARDEADIRGHRRTYVGAMPGRVMQGLKQARTKNPVFLLDEVDKLGVSLQGDPSAALLEVLDPAQNHAFVDHYLGLPFDLSEVLFIATANYGDRIPPPLLDRMETVDFTGYTEHEKLEIAKRYLLPRQLRESGLTAAQLELSDGAIQRIISGYTREAGVRQAERELGKVARKAARRIAGGEVEQIVVGDGDVVALIGRPKVHPERAATEDAVGTVTGMYYTPMGGDIMFVEASVAKGKDNLILTGQLGDVMKESARAALTYAKTYHARLGIPPENLKDLEIHIHVPAGAVPKDGPSAGITMATALVSSLSGRAVRHDLAMTGEITLTGRVLPIGGVKEKVLGALRAGIQVVVLPADNESDLDDLPAEAKERLRFHFASDLGEVLGIALRGARLEKGVLTFGDDAAAAVLPGDANPVDGPLFGSEGRPA
jgi:ATP-dependent Lon protease